MIWPKSGKISTNGPLRYTWFVSNILARHTRWRLREREERERERSDRIKRNTPKCRWSVKTIKLNIPNKCRCGWPFPLHSVFPYLGKLWLVGSWGEPSISTLPKLALAKGAILHVNLWPNPFYIWGFLMCSFLWKTLQVNFQTNL